MSAVTLQIEGRIGRVMERIKREPVAISKRLAAGFYWVRDVNSAHPFVAEWNGVDGWYSTGIEGLMKPEQVVLLSGILTPPDGWEAVR